MAGTSLVLWWCVLGALIGVLVSWGLGRMSRVPLPAAAAMDAPAPLVVEKIVEKPVDRPVDRIVDNPAHLQRIAALEGQLGELDSLRGQLQALQAQPVQPADTVHDATMPLDVAPTMPFTRQAPVVETPAAAPEPAAAPSPAPAPAAPADGTEPIDMEAARQAGFNLKGPNDLEVIEGIGPKIAEMLRAEGITTFAKLAAKTPAELKAILAWGGPTYKLANPQTWPDQADLAARNRWPTLRIVQDSLIGGRR